MRDQPDGCVVTKIYCNAVRYSSIERAIVGACIPSDQMYLFRRSDVVLLMNSVAWFDPTYDVIHNYRASELVGRMPTQEAIDMAEIILRMS